MGPQVVMGRGGREVNAEILRLYEGPAVPDKLINSGLKCLAPCCVPPFT
jgi:hypothetical protein